MNDTRPVALVRWLDAERQNDPFLADLIEPAITSVLIEEPINDIEFVKMGDMWKLPKADLDEDASATR